MAPRVGFEPTTLRLTAECSTAELSRNICGGAKRIRTAGLLSAIQALYHLSYSPTYGAEGRTRTGTGITRALLRRVRLPIPPLRHRWRAQRDSNSRPFDS